MFETQKPKPKKRISFQDFLKIRFCMIAVFAALAAWIFITNQLYLNEHANEVVTTDHGFSYLKSQGYKNHDIFLILSGVAFSTRFIFLCFVTAMVARLTSPKRLLKVALKKQGSAHMTRMKRTVIISDGKGLSRKEENTESEMDLTNVDLTKLGLTKIDLKNWK